MTLWIVFFCFSVFFLFSFPIRGGGFISDLSRDLNQEGLFCIEVVSFFSFNFFYSCSFSLLLGRQICKPGLEDDEGGDYVDG